MSRMVAINLLASVKFAKSLPLASLGVDVSVSIASLAEAELLALLLIHLVLFCAASHRADSIQQVLVREEFERRPGGRASEPGSRACSETSRR